jgi:hypothetical protein
MQHITAQRPHRIATAVISSTQECGFPKRHLSRIIHHTAMQNALDRLAALPSSGNFSRKRLLTAGFFIFALLAAYQVAGYIIGGNFTSLELIAFGFGCFAFVIVVLKDWRRGLYVAFAWLLFEDFSRKFLGNNMAIYFVKDVLITVVYLSFFVAYQRKSKSLKSFRPPFIVPLIIFVWFGLMQVFNPGSTSIFYGLMGMKIYFYYTPLIVLGYALINTERDLRRFFYFNLALMLVIAALGVVQSIAGPTFLSPEVMADDIALLSHTYREAPISGAVVYRPTSVFVSAGRFVDLLIVAWVCALGFGGYLLLRPTKGRWFSFVVLTVTAGACVMCASRGAFMWTLGNGVVAAGAFIWGAPWRQGNARHAFRGLQRVVLGAVLAMTVLFFTYPDQLLNRFAVYKETLDPRSPTSELSLRTREYPMQNFLSAFSNDRWPYGYGIGTVSLGGQYVSRIFHVSPPALGPESGFGAIVTEMGIVGLLLWLIMSAAILIPAWRVVRKLRGSPWFPLGFMIFWYALILLIPFTFLGLQAYQDFILNAYLWLLLGILFRLPTIKLAIQSAAQRAER